jgi:hypothetical protein
MTKNGTKTPAPWTADAFGDDSYDIYDGLGNCIATVHGPGDGTGDGATANLIAAAPELLASLTNLRDWLVAIVDGITEDDRSMLAAATDAIDRANRID